MKSKALTTNLWGTMANLIKNFVHFIHTYSYMLTVFNAFVLAEAESKAFLP